MLHIVQMKKCLISGLCIGSACLLAGELADLYKKMYETRQAAKAAPDVQRSWGHYASVVREHGITEIGLERTVCLGTCPAYSVTIGSDGTVRYHGIDNVARKGELSGKLSAYYVDHLATFICDAGYGELDASYSRAIEDGSTTYTTVVRNGRRKTVSNYYDAGPILLWAIEQLIDTMMDKVAWAAPTKKGDTPQ